MSEERAHYDARPPEERNGRGLQHIGEIIDQMADEHGWPSRSPRPTANGNTPPRSGRRHE